MRALDVRLRDRHVGRLVELERGGDYSFEYEASVALTAPGAPLLSVSLPCRERPFEPTEARPFFEGLLPEGEIRERIARDLKVSTSNSFELLARLGRDCAGAVVLLPEGEQPDDEPIEWLAAVTTITHSVTTPTRHARSRALRRTGLRGAPTAR